MSVTTNPKSKSENYSTSEFDLRLLFRSALQDVLDQGGTTIRQSIDDPRLDVAIPAQSWVMEQLSMHHHPEIPAFAIAELERLRQFDQLYNDDDFRFAL